METTQFTRRIAMLGLENDLRHLQQELLANPEKGVLDPGTGGLRKVRMGDHARQQGKRSGARVHYVVAPHPHVIFLVFVYTKSERSRLTKEQKDRLRPIVQQLLDE